MAIEIQQTKGGTTKYVVTGTATLAEIHIALARGISEIPSGRCVLHLDLSAANLDAEASEIERFIGYLEGALLPRVTVAEGRFIVRTSDNPIEDALPFTQSLAALSRRSATLHIVTRSQERLLESNVPSTQEHGGTVAERLKRIVDDDGVANLKSRETNADLPVVTSEDVAFAAAV